MLVAYQNFLSQMDVKLGNRLPKETGIFITGIFKSKLGKTLVMEIQTRMILAEAGVWTR